MKLLTLILGLFFLLGTTYVHAEESESDQKFSIYESNEIKYWVIEKD
jgi:hypothetical protein